MPFTIVRNDISRMQADAIVNSSGCQPRVGPGVDAAIHKKAGPSLLAARQELGTLAPGTAAITPAFGLDADYIIHAATPTWVDGAHGEAACLYAAYEQCLALAAEHGCEHVAFPLLAAGNHGFPQSTALQVAIQAFSSFLLHHEMQIDLVVFDRESVRLSEKLMHSVRSFIDEHYVEDYVQEQCAASEGLWESRSLRCRDEGRRPCAPAASRERPTAPASDELSLSDFLRQKDAGFVETLLALIQEKGLKNADVYKRANISRQHFSKLLNAPDARPSKQTAIALALALRLDLPQTRDLIGRAGYALTDSSTFDLIIRYFIERRQFNVIEINLALYEFDQTLLGA